MGMTSTYTLTWKLPDNYAEELERCHESAIPGMKFCPECGKPVGKNGFMANVANWIRASEERSFCMFVDGSPIEPGKWYTHEVDLAEFSRHHPEVLFILDFLCDGDHHRKYFKGGLVQRALVRIVFDEFDISKLGGI